MTEVRVLLAVAAGLLSIGAPASGRGDVQTLYRDPDAPITAFAQDGSVVAWFSPRTDECNSVDVLSLGGVRLTLPKPGTNNVTCRWDVGDSPVQLALASSNGGVAALWTLHERTHGAPVDLDYVLGATAKTPLERRFYEVAHNRSGAGLWLGGIAGDGDTLVYSVTEVAYVNQVACLSGGSCRLKIKGGAVHRVVGRRDPSVPHTGPALELTAAGGMIAYVPAAGLDAQGRPAALAGRSVQVRTVADGHLVSQVETQGLPLALALSTKVLAVLKRSGSRTTIAWFDPASGKPLGSVGVPAGTAGELTASDQLIVYHVGRLVRGIDVGTGRVRTLVTTETPPVGLSLQGSRLAWAVNVGGKGRVQALFIQGRG